MTKDFVIIEKDCDDWKRLWLKKIHACNKTNFSSNVNEVIRAVLNSLFIITFFYRKFFHAPKAPKAPKASKAQRRNQAKAKNGTSQQK